MKISLEDLRQSVAKKIITKKQLEEIVLLSSTRKEASPDFGFLQILYYLIAAIIIGSMGIFMISGWEWLGKFGVLILSFIYAIIFTASGTFFLLRKKNKTAGGLLITLAVFMTPLFVYGIEHAIGLWPMDNPDKYQGFNVWINGSWLMIELATIGTGCIAIAVVRFPLITAPVACALWYMSMDLVPLVFGKNYFSGLGNLVVSAVVGFLMIAFSFYIDRKTKEDYSFWGYLFGIIAFWGAASAMDMGSIVAKTLYVLLNLVMITASFWLGRRLFVIFGGLGIFGYLNYLSFNLFRNTLFFPFTFAILALILISGIIIYQRTEKRLYRWFNRIFPVFLKKYQPGNRTSII